VRGRCGRTALLSALLVAALAQPAVAQQAVSCGQPITKSVTLKSDLNCSGSDAIVIGASNITVNLGGHRVVGVSGIGVRNSGGYDRVTVKNGVVSSDVGIQLINASRNTLRNLENRSFVRGIELRNSDRNRIVSSREVFFGIRLLEGSDGNLVARNTVGDALAGIEVIDSHRNAIVGNDVRTPGEGPALLVGGSSRRTLVARNNVLGRFDGIFVAASTRRTVLRGNVANGSDDDGIDVESPSTFLRRNRANDNGDLGIEAVEGVTDGGRNRAAGNGNPIQCLNVHCLVAQGG
jgi:parallel beta-helix repeat protein